MLTFNANLNLFTKEDPLKRGHIMGLELSLSYNNCKALLSPLLEH